MVHPVRPKSAVPARDLSALAWVAPNMRAALDDAVREFSEYAADVIANPEVIGARDTTSLRLAGQYLHQAAGALLIVGLRGVDVYCQAAKRLLEAVDAGTVAADVQTLDVFSRAVQALQEYVTDLMAGMAEEPLRLFQPYQTVLARLGEERIHPADLWADELRHLPALLLPSRDLPGLARLRRKFELALLTALRAPSSAPSSASASNADGAQVDPSAAAAAYAPLEDLLHGIRALEREPRRTGDDLQRDLWLVLALTFGALRAGLVPADMTAKRLAARVNLLLRQYSHNNVHLPQGLLTDALYLLAGMAYSNVPTAPVGDDTLGPDIVACVQAFAIPPTHAPASALHTRQYYALLPMDASDTLQRVGRSLEALSQQPAPAADELDAALQTLALHADALGQPALSDLSNRLTEAGVQDVAPTLQFLSRMLARPWALHGESGDLRSAWFAARCSELAEHARATQDGHAVPAPAWLTLLAEETAQRRTRAEQVRALQTLLASAETHLDAFEREGEESGGLQEAARLFGEMQSAFAAIDADEAVHATEAAQSTITALQAAGVGKVEPVGADRERYLAALAANVSGLQALLDALSAGTELTGGQVDEIVIETQLTPTERETAWREFAFDAESGMLARREPQSEAQAGADIADADAASPLQSLLDRLLAKQPVDPADPLAAELRTTLQEARDAAAIDDDPARRRRLEEALAQFDAWQVGSPGALERMQAALAAPAAAPAAATAPAPAAVRDIQSIDAELLDIFLSEAEDVLAGVRTDLHGLQAAADVGTGGLAAGSDLDLLTQLRRAFHTLKGSGRMVGLTRYGEAAWAIEQVMNVWLAESRVPTHDLAALLARAESELSTWAAAIAQSPQADHAIEPLVAAAERVRHGGPFVWPEAMPEAHAPAEHAEQEAPAAETASHDLAAPETLETPAAPAEPIAESDESVALTWDDEAALPEVEAPMHEATAPVAEPIEEAIPEAVAEPVGDDADAKVIPFPFAQTGEPEEAPHDDGVKEIGPVRISVALYNVYLQEADDLIRRLGLDFSEWRHEGRTPPSERALRAAHTLQGSSAVVELEPVRQLAAALEQVLLNLNSRPVAMHPGDFRLLDQAIERMRGMLHQFAAGLWPETDEPLRRSLDELCERLLVRPRLPLEPAPAAFTDAEQAENETAGLAGEPEFEPAAITPTFVPALVPVHESPVAEPAVGELVRQAPADALDPALLEIFLEEAHVALPELGQHLRAWEAAPQDRNAAGLLLRNLHTVKGSARMAGAMTLGQAAHEMESAIEGGLRQNRVDDALFRKLYVWFDRIQAHVDALGAGNLLPLDAGLADAADAQQAATDVQTASGASMLPAVAASTSVDLTGTRSSEAEALEVAERQRAMVRVQARALDSLINDAGEVGAARARLESEVDALKTYLSELNDNVARLRSQVREIEIQAETQMESRIADAAAHDESFDPLEFDRFTRLQELTRMMAESVNDVATVQQNLFRGFDQASLDLETQARLTRGLQRSLMRARMVQFDTVADRLYRVARQAASETGKEVRLFIKGGTVELDRSVLDRMGGPLEHMIRNAVAHGIESADERRAKGKTAAGELTLEVQQEGNEVVLHFVDDGAGLNLDRIRARALERQLLAADEDASDARLTEMIFTPGFSTADQVSELAGRGVGMDVVRAETVALGGRISLQTTPEVGTRFTIHLPLTTAITQVLLVRVGERVYAIPSGMIDHVQQLRPQALAEAYNAAALQLPTGPVPFHYFGALLEEAAPVTGGRKYSPAVVVRNGADRAAVHVDEVIGNREVVVKHIGPHLARLEGIAGATTLGDGEIVLIYNPVVLTQRFEREAAARGLSDQEATGAVAELQRDGSTDAVPGLATQPIVMVVDDSLTVRKVTQRLLTRSGYQAVLARDGVDALRQLQDVTPDAMLVDIEMPHMDGFDLTRNVRADERIGATPIIMITSRTADKHRRYAAEIGVNVYLGKPYNEEELLKHLRNLIGDRAPAAANAG